MKCPNCGAEVKSTSRFCEYCGSSVSPQMIKEQEQLNKAVCPKCGSTNISYSREKQGEIKGKRGTAVIRSTIGVCKDCGYTWQTDSGTPTAKKSNTWLWVLGWICIFPIPLTILLLRKKDMKPSLKYGIIAVAWIVYLIIALSGGSSKEQTTSASTESASTESVISKDETAKYQDNLQNYLDEIVNTDISSYDVPTKLAEKYGLDCYSGIGSYIVANQGDLNVNKVSDGKDYISFEADYSNDYAIENIEYFNNEKLIYGYYRPDWGYYYRDLNNPQRGMVVQIKKSYDGEEDHITDYIAVQGLDELLAYVNSDHDYSNTCEELEQFFCQINASMGEVELCDFTREAGLCPDVSATIGGWDELVRIAYSDNVAEANGNFDYCDEDGTKINVRYRSTDDPMSGPFVITSIEYMNYAVLKNHNVYGVIYTDNSNQYEADSRKHPKGFYIIDNGNEKEVGTPEEILAYISALK